MRHRAGWRQAAARSGIFSSRHGQDVGEQDSERAGQKHHTGCAPGGQGCHDRCNDDDRDDGEGEHAVIDEQSDQLARNAGERSHGATSSGRLTATAARAATSRKSAAKPMMARSAPGQATPRPSPVQNTPKADSMTPTANLSVFSDTRASGRRSTSPAIAIRPQAASAPALASRRSSRPEPTAITMKTTSSPSSSTALKLASPASQSRRERCSLSSTVPEANAAASSCSGTTPAARRIALRSQRMPKRRSSTPITSCRRWSGTRSSSGPRTATISASEANPAAAPSPAGRQPRTVATARTMVSASMASTSDPRKAAEMAGAEVAQVMPRPARRRRSSSPPQEPSTGRVLGRVSDAYPWVHAWGEKARPRAFHAERDPGIAVRARWGFARDQLLGSVRTRRWLNHGAMLGGTDCALVARLCSSVTAVTSACRQHARQGGSDFAGLHRLLQDLVDACRRCTFAHHGTDVAADEQDRKLGTAAVDHARELSPRKSGHHFIGDRRVEAPGLCFELRERCQAFGEGDRLVAEARKHLGGHREKRLLIVDHQHSLAIAPGDRALFLVVVGYCHVDARHVDRERGAAPGGARHVDCAAGVSDDAVNERQSEPGPLADLLRREKRLEDAAERCFVHARPRVLDGETRIGSGDHGAVRQRALGADLGGFEGHAQRTFPAHRLNRIRAQIHHDLMQLRRVTEYLQRRGGQLRLEAYFGVQRAAHELQRLGDDPAEIDSDALAVLAAAIGEDLVDQAARPVRRGENVLRVALEWRARGGLLDEHFGVAQDASEDVVEVVRDATSEAADRLHLLRLPQALLEPRALGIGELALGDVAEVHH